MAQMYAKHVGLGWNAYFKASPILLHPSPSHVTLHFHKTDSHYKVMEA